MINYKFIPASTAQQLSEVSKLNCEFEFTITESIDEKKLFDTINTKLIALETKIEIDIVELNAISKMVEEFRIAIDEKEELHLRIDWLKRLYQAKEEIQAVDNKEKAKRLRKLIISVQTCPLKQQLLSKLDELEQSLNEENAILAEFSREQQLMEKAIKEAGDVFINLGKVGREFVIASVLQQFGERTSMDSVKENAVAIEQRVTMLAELNDPDEMISCLKQLPLSSFNQLKTSIKEEIAKRLIDHNKWNGLSALDRQIVHLEKVINNEERKQEEAKYTIETENGRAAFALNVENDNLGIVKIG